MIPSTEYHEISGSIDLETPNNEFDLEVDYVADLYIQPSDPETNCPEQRHITNVSITQPPWANTKENRNRVRDILENSEFQD